MAANERQVGGTHYKTGGEEHWDRVARLNLDYFQGQITKYVERWKLKNGVQDLEKARHFLDKYIEVEQKKAKAEDEKRNLALALHRGQAGASADIRRAEYGGEVPSTPQKLSTED